MDDNHNSQPDLSNSDQDRRETRRSLTGMSAVHASLARVARLTAVSSLLDKTGIGAVLGSLDPVVLRLNALNSAAGRNPVASVLASVVTAQGANGASTLELGGAVARSLASSSLMKGRDTGLGSTLQASSAAMQSLKIGHALSTSLKMAELMPFRSTIPESLLRQVSMLQGAGLFEALSNAEPETLQSLLESVEREVGQGENDQPRYIVAEADAEYGESGAEEAQREIIRALQGKSGQVKLSLQALRIFLASLFVATWLYDQTGKWNDFRESICDINQRVLTAPSLRHARDFTSKFLCGVPPELSARMRLVNRDGVSLRDEPKLKSKVIMKLPVYSWVEVIDSKDRKWIRVAYKHEGREVVGWLTRGMARKAPGR